MSNKQLDYISWPKIDNVLDMKPVLLQLEESQWYSQSKLSEIQFTQLKILLAYHYEHSKFLKKTIDENSININEISNWDDFRKIPLLKRFDIQQNFEELTCDKVPEQHEPCGSSSTSGTSGMPVKAIKTSVNQLLFFAYRMRNHIWHKRRYDQKLATIKAGMGIKQVTEIESWGQPVALFFKTAKAYLIPIKMDVTEQLNHLVSIQPKYLITYPSNFFALMQEMEKQNVNIPNLEEFMSMGETLHPHIKEKAENKFGLKVTDVYSSEELGIIAIQCADCGDYHVMEGLYIEVLDDKGMPCKAGEVGKIVVTDLYNFSMPLIRYELLDYAELGDSCSCGRGLVNLKRIIGSERHMMKVNGKKSWPMTSFARFNDIAPIIQYQMVQKTNDLLELRIYAKSPLTKEDEGKITDLINKYIGHKFNINFTYYDNFIPSKPSGKFEEFICEIDER